MELKDLSPGMQKDIIMRPRTVAEATLSSALEMVQGNINDETLGMILDQCIELLVFCRTSLTANKKKIVDFKK